MKLKKKKYSAASYRKKRPAVKYPCIHFTLALLLLFLLPLAATACSMLPPLPETYVEAEVEARAQGLIELVNAGDYDALALEVREDLRADYPAEDIKNAWEPKVTKLGAFKAFEAYSVFGQPTKADGDYAVIVMVVQYENDSASYTFYFDEAMALVALYMK